jgi:asparagine synthase (glutamine-hydrolysing)
MSGIAGIFLFNDQPVPPDQLACLTSTMHRLGPDGITHWQSGHVALGHCLLRTTPEACEERQPLQNESRQLVMVMDGRLDNTDELRRELQSRGITAGMQSDVDLVIRAYELWGEACVDHFLGDFALVVWDARRRQLFCARDHLGARPFYFAATDRGLFIASEDEALTQMPGVTTALDDDKVADYFAPGMVVDPAKTWLRDVRKLMPGEAMTVGHDGCLRRWSYWNPEREPTLCLASDKEYWEAFLDVFGLAVKARMRSVTPLAAMVSGGLDTAAIVAMLRRFMASGSIEQFHAYSVVADEAQTCIETQCINDLSAHPQTVSHQLKVPSMSGVVTMADLKTAAWTRPHPTDNSILLLSMMCLAAQRNNHRVMLMGTSGDITMHVPLRYIAQLIQRGDWQTAWREAKGASQNNPYLRGTSALNLFALNFGLAYAPSKLRSLTRGLLEQLKGPSEARLLMAPELAQRVQFESRRQANLHKQARDFRAGGADPDAERRVRQTAITNGLNGFARVAGRYGVELRDPWADRRVVSFFLRLPLHQLIRNGWTKYQVRQAFGQDLSPIITGRTGKEHLGWHLTIRAMEDMRRQLLCFPEDQLDLLRPYADLDRVRQVFRNYAESGGVSAAEQASKLLCLVMFLQRLSGTAKDGSLSP